jgi:hypothetical protein
MSAILRDPSRSTARVHAAGASKTPIHRDREVKRQERDKAAQLPLDLLIPLRIGLGLNERGHWTKQAARVEREKRAALLVLQHSGPAPARAGLPMRCVLTRVTPSAFADSDNVIAGLKSVRDAVAEWLGTGDAWDGPVTWDYDQVRGEWGVRVRVEEVP